jgi:hypothetical protein
MERAGAGTPPSAAGGSRRAPRPAPALPLAFTTGRGAAAPGPRSSSALGAARALLAAADAEAAAAAAAGAAPLLPMGAAFPLRQMLTERGLVAHAVQPGAEREAGVKRARIED